jgi:hypothetical protein
MHGCIEPATTKAQRQRALKCAVDFAALDSAYLDFSDRNLLSEIFLETPQKLSFICSKFASQNGRGASFCVGNRPSQNR